MTAKEAIEWMRSQQAIFDATGNKKDRRPEQVANLLEGMTAAMEQSAKIIDVNLYHQREKVQDAAMLLRQALNPA